MKRLVLLLLILTFIYPNPVFAHAFGTQYTLPIPFYLYFWGAGAALIASFVVIGFFIRQTKKDASYKKIDISKSFLGSLINNKLFLFAIKIIGFIFFILAIATGLWGVNDFEFNLNMTLFWIIFILGITYLSAIFGNIYSIINPLKNSIEFIEYIWNTPIKGFFPYPKWLEYYPACLFYFLLIWFELVGETTPHKLSIIILSYAFITLIGTLTFGKNVWFEKADFLSIFFSLLSLVSPFEYQKGKLYLRPPFIGLITKKTASFSLLIFILFMLSSTAFDGFRETLAWGGISSAISESLRSFLGFQTETLIDTVFLLLSPFFFLIIYLFILIVTKLIANTTLTLLDSALEFSFSLIPIALVYNISHYYTLFAIQGQDIIRLASDPFGLGWNLFQTDTFVPNINLLSTKFIWQTEVAFLLGGHIAAVYISHLLALNVFPSHKKVIISQFPMLILMVAYTVLGLWILSQPLSVGK